MNPDSAPDAALTYLVVVPDAVVAQDIASAIADLDPGARVLVAAGHPHEALELLFDVGPVALAVVEADPETLAATAFGAALVARGARIVLVGDAAEEAGEVAGYAVLARPFDNAALFAALRLARG